MINFQVAPGAKVLELGGGENPTSVTTCNMDVRPGPTVHIVHDLERTPWPLRDAEWDAVIAVYALEHVSWRQIPDVLSEVFRVTKPGGKLALMLPNTEAQMRWIVDHPEGWDSRDLFGSAGGLLFGDQDYSANAHRAFLSPDIITKLLTDAGFCDVTVIAAGARSTDMAVEATKPQVSIVEPARAAEPEVKVANKEEDLAPLDTPEQRAEAFDSSYFGGGGKWGGYAHQGLADFPVHHLTAKYVLDRKPRSVLELGAARGYIGKRVEDAGVPYLGLEISNHCYLTRVAKGVVRHDACLGQWPAQDKTFDLAFSIAVMEHIPEKFLPVVIGEMARTCDRGLMGIDFGGNDDGFDKTHCTLRDQRWWYDKFEEIAPGWPVEVVDKEELERVPSTGFPKRIVEGDGKVKLNLGSFTTMFLHGWINVDTHDLGGWAASQGYRYLRSDVRAGLPFMTGTVDLAFCHHMLEHLTYVEGLSLLRDLRRAMKIGGAIRIAVPDGKALCDRYVIDHMIGDGEYCNTLSDLDDMNQGCAESPAPAGKLHALLCAGHAAIYDEVNLVGALAQAGFNCAVARFREAARPHSGTEQILRETTEMWYGGSALVVDAWPRV